MCDSSAPCRSAVTAKATSLNTTHYCHREPCHQTIHGLSIIFTETMVRIPQRGMSQGLRQAAACSLLLLLYIPFIHLAGWLGTCMCVCCPLPWTVQHQHTLKNAPAHDQRPAPYSQPSSTPHHPVPLCTYIHPWMQCIGPHHSLHAILSAQRQTCI